MLYTLAVNTGLRASELASLTPASFTFAADSPTVIVKAAYSKHRRDDLLDLRPDVAGEIKDFTTGMATDAKLWPGSWAKDRHAGSMLKVDLKAADIPYKTAEGFADFHCLRHTFISRLAQAGVHPTIAQSLARHSTITLTMDRYTHVRSADQRAALSALPGVVGRGPAATAVPPKPVNGQSLVAPMVAPAGRTPGHAETRTDSASKPPAGQAGPDAESQKCRRGRGLALSGTNGRNRTSERVGNDLRLAPTPLISDGYNTTHFGGSGSTSSGIILENPRSPGPISFRPNSSTEFPQTATVRQCRNESKRPTGAGDCQFPRPGASTL
jgi:hypothetical protein